MSSLTIGPFTEPEWNTTQIIASLAGVLDRLAGTNTSESQEAMRAPLHEHESVITQLTGIINQIIHDTLSCSEIDNMFGIWPDEEHIEALIEDEAIIRIFGSNDIEAFEGIDAHLLLEDEERNLSLYEPVLTHRLLWKSNE